MKDNINTFWDWFVANNNAYLFLNQVDPIEKERLLGNLLVELHKYCEKLFFEVGGKTDGNQQLIITAEGNTDYFDQVEALVSKAPALDNWTFFALIPPMGSDFQIEFEGVTLVPNEMWFLPLESPGNPSAIGIRVCIRNYELIKDHDYFMSTIYEVLDTVVGEKTFATDIDYIETEQLPDYPEEEGMIELAELGAYIKWKKKKLQSI